MEITNDIKYVGVNDREIDLFEGQYIVENGMAYNSYVILDEKTAVMDSVDVHFSAEWLSNIKAVLDSRQPDYLIIQHMEPDHSGSIAEFMEAFPETKVVSSAKSFAMMKQFFGTDFSDRQVVVKDGDTLGLGSHTLSFIAAPMVHWPEVIVTYDAYDKVLFSADGFGKFGALDTEEDWACEARRYYFGIVGKFGVQVQNLLKKAAALDIQAICPLHGPILTKNLSYYIGLYQTWSSYSVESEGVMIAYSSVYGNTKKAAELLAEAVEADVLLILTEVEKAAIRFGKPDQQDLDRISLAEAARYAAEGQFGVGSMLPKVEAAMKFVRANPGKRAIITSLSKALDALDGKTGTQVTFA